MKKVSTKKPRKSRVLKTRNLNTQTEAAFWGHMRSSFRRSFRYWKPAVAAKLAARRVHTKTHDGDRQKWDYQCAHCQAWFPDKLIEVDHKIPCGSLRSWEDVVPFLKRLIPEDPASFQVLCDTCHQVKTNAEREAKADSAPAVCTAHGSSSPASFQAQSATHLSPAA